MPKEKDEFTWQIEDYKEVLRRIAIEQMGPDLQLYWSQNPHILPFNLEGSNSSSSYEEDCSPEGDSRSLVDDSDSSSVSTNSPRRDDRLGMEDDDQQSRERYDEKYGQRKDTKNPPRRDDEEFGQRVDPRNPSRRDDPFEIDDVDQYDQRMTHRNSPSRHEEEYGQRKDTKNPPRHDEEEFGQREDPNNPSRRDESLEMDDEDWYEQRSRKRYEKEFGQRKNTNKQQRHDDEEFRQRKDPKKLPRHDDEENDHRVDPKNRRRDDEEFGQRKGPKKLLSRSDKEFGQRKGPKKLLTRDEEEYGQRMDTKKPSRRDDEEFGQQKNSQKTQRRDDEEIGQRKDPKNSPRRDDRLGVEDEDWYDQQSRKRYEKEFGQRKDALEGTGMAVGHGRGQSLKSDGVKPKPMHKNKSGAKKTTGASGARGQIPGLDDLKNKILQTLFGAKKAIDISKAGGQGVGPGAGLNQGQYKRKIEPDEETIQKWINQNWSKEQIDLYNNPERLLRRFQPVTDGSVHVPPSQPQYKNQDRGQSDRKTIPEEETIQKWKEENKSKKYAQQYANSEPLSQRPQRVTDDFAYSPLSPPQNKGSPTKKNKNSEDSAYSPLSPPQNKGSPNKRTKIDKAKDKENILGLPPTKDLKDMKINPYLKLPSIPKPRPNNDDDA